jgi:hypothetical protein
VRRWDRWAAATGIGFVVLTVLAFLIVPDPPAPDDGSEFILNFFIENDSDVMWQSFFYGLAGVLLLLFGGTLAGSLRRAGADPAGGLPATVAASAATAVALYLLGVVSWGALASGVETMDQGVAYGLFQVGGFAFVLTNFPAAAFVLAASLGITRTGLMPAAVGWVGSVVAVYLIVTAGGRTLGDSDAFAAGGSLGVVAFLAFLFWVFVASVFLVQRAAPARTTPEG